MTKKIKVNPVEASSLSSLLFDYYQSDKSSKEFNLLMEYIFDSYTLGEEILQRDYPPLSDFTMQKLVNIIVNDYEVEYPDIKAGDMVVTRGGVNDCDVRFVEGADSGCILLVNGIQDVSYTLPEQLEEFWSQWEILCKLEDRKDSSARYYTTGGNK